MALTLAFLRAAREDDWAGLLAAHPHQVTSMTTGLRSRLEELIGDRLESLRDLPSGKALADTIEAVDSTARQIGDATTFELILDEFVAAGGRLFTPKSVTTALARMLDVTPASTVYDPFCRTGELLIAARMVAQANSPHATLHLYGDTPDSESLSVARMNILLHDVEGELGWRDVIGLRDVRREAPRFSVILSNPPFNVANWDHGDQADWHYGRPPKHNANFAWLQYAVERLEPGGRAGIIMANNAASSANHTEKQIRMRMVEDGCVDALISLPPALFPGTGVPAMIWLLTPPNATRNEILFVDASGAGRMVSRTRRALDESAMTEIVQTVRDWSAGQPPTESRDLVNAIAVPLQKIRDLDYDLNPAAFLQRPYSPPGAADALPAVRDLAARLDAEHSIADQKHSDATDVVQRLSSPGQVSSPSPADWPEVRLTELCDLVAGTPTHDAPDGSVPVLKPRNLVLGGLAGPTDMLSADEANRLSRYQMRDGDLLCVRTGTVGRTGLATHEQDRWIFGTGLIRIRAKPDSPVDPRFLSLYFTHPIVVEWIRVHATRGTSIPNISSHVLGSLPVRLPPLSIQQAIGGVLGKLNDSITAHRRISETTAELRDTLLPLLMSGSLPAS